MSQLNSLVFFEEEVREIFGPILKPRDFDRVAMQISRFNQKAAPFKAAFRLNRSAKNIEVLFSRAAQLEEFAARLISCQGVRQKKFGLHLSRKFNGRSDPYASLWILRERQAKALLASAVPPGSLFDIFNFQSFWVSPPYGVLGKKVPESGVLKDLAFYLNQTVCGKGASKAVFLIGGFGSGKSAALTSAYLKTAESKGPWKGPMESFPVFVPGKCLDFQAQNPSIKWEAIPGGVDQSAPQLEELFKAGRLILFLDGLDENPKSFDFEDSRVVRLWRKISQNYCIFSCRDFFWTAYAKPSFFKEIFLNRISFIQLAPWTHRQIENFYFKLPEASKRNFKLRAKIVKNPLDAWLAASRVITIKEHVAELVEWETDKPGNIFCSEIALSLLTQMALRIYSGEAISGLSPEIPLEEIWRDAVKKYPFFEGRKAEFFASLERLPFVQFDRFRGVFRLEASIGNCLAYSQKPSQKPVFVKL